MSRMPVLMIASVFDLDEMEVRCKLLPHCLDPVSLSMRH